MNNDLISREALKNHIIDIFDEEVKHDKKWAMGLKYSLKIIDKALTIEERPQGEWIKWNFKTFGAMGDWEYKCSNCEKVYGGEYNFCPNCGAQMKEGAE